MNPKELVRQYLSQVNIMQLATSVNDQPWVITVHFYADENFNLYWMSNKVREHSEHILQNDNVAATIMVHENTSEEKYVIGISIQGTAQMLEPPIDESVKQGYTNKHNANPGMLEEATKRDGTEAFYMIKPSRIVLFDTKNLQGNPRQVLEDIG